MFIIFVLLLISAVVLPFIIMDDTTRMHSWRVAVISFSLAQNTNINAVWAFVNGLYHDVGKILIPKSILSKPGRLTDDEYQMIKTHTTNVLARLYGLLLPAVTGHHLSYSSNGGYGLKKGGEEVSEIVSIADVYEALTAKRPYKEALTSQKAVTIMANMDGKFNPKFFENFAETVAA